MRDGYVDFSLADYYLFNEGFNDLSLVSGRDGWGCPGEST
jgi:hypothetical protein